MFSVQAISATEIDGNVTLNVNQVDVDYGSDSYLDLYSSSQNDAILTADGDMDTFTNLQILINSTPENGIINLNSDYQCGNGESGLIINKSLTINGNGHKLDGNNLTTILHLNQGNIILKNITVINGYSETSAGGISSGNISSLNITNSKFINNYGLNGGAIFWNATSQGLFISDSEFTNNSARFDGGAIFWNGINGTVKDSSFTDNTAGDDGGAMFWQGNVGLIDNITCVNNIGISQGDSSSRGGTICLTASNITVTRSSFKSGVARCDEGKNSSKVDGGALFVTGNNVNITDTVFSQCNATNKGGAIYIIGNNTLLDNCSFEECSATFGGVIYVVGNEAKIDNSDFNDNYAIEDGGALYVQGDYCEASNITFTNNVAGDDGGAINWDGDHGTIYNITCYNNRGISQNGSSSRGGSICLTGSNVTLSKSSFNMSYALYNEGANASKIDGGALFVTGNNVNITDSTFNDCTSSNNGGAIYIIGNNTLVDNCSFEECNASFGGVIYVLGNDAVIDNSDFNDNYASKDGGALFVQGDNCDVSNTTFTNNVAGDDGGAINWEGDYGSVYNITCANNRGISAGTSNSKGGTICLTGSNVVVDKSSFKDSFVTYNGGALFITGNNVNITNSEFKNCSCDVTASIKVKDQPYGGALYVIGNNTDVLNCTFDDCTAINGGVIFVEGNDAFISESSFNETSATKSGGAIYIVGEDAVINDSNFTNTSSTNPGGAIYVKGSDAVINGSDFTDISAHDNGGAIFVDGRNTHINGSSFLKCFTESKAGGAIYINNVGTNVSYSNFTSTHATTAGAIYINGTNTNIEYCNLDKNYATGSAGAIHVSGDNARLYYVNFTDNVAKGDGGALDIGGQNASVYYSYFDNNDANRNGGAINWIGGHGDDSIIGCLFTNNNCNNTSNGGGAVYWTAGTVISSGGLIKDSIFINNTASGRHGGAVNWFRTLDSKIDNCTFINNTANSDGGALYTGDQNGGSYNLTVSNSQFYNNTAKKHGGAIANQMGGSYLYNNTFNGNKASSSGGTILMKEGHADNSVIDSCYIYNSFVNKPINLNYGESGGAIRIGASDDNIVIKNCIIINSTTNSTMGGAISIQGKNCKLDNITIINATSNNDQGGAIYWSGANGKMTNVNITNASTHTQQPRNDNRDIDGGAIYWSGNNAYLANVTITNAYTNSTDSNRDAHGGAIYIGSNSANLYNVSVNNSYASSVDSNKAYGGAIYLSGGNSNKNIHNATLINNTASKGGAIYGADSQTRLYDSLLRNNSAEEGGAAYFQNGGHYIEGSSFENNTADYGGAIYYSGSNSSNSKIKDSNITFNKAIQGSGVYYNSSDVNLENVVLLDNQAHANKFTNKFIKLEDDGTYSIGTTFVGYDNLLNAMWLESSSVKEFKQVTYWDVGGVTQSSTQPSKTSDNEVWQNITVERYDESGALISNTTVPIKTDANGVFKFNVGSGINLRDTFKFYHLEDSYYTYAEDTISNITLISVVASDIHHGENTYIKINLTDGNGNPLTGNITLKLNETGFENVTVEVVNGVGILNNISNLSVGKYNVSVLYLPSSTYFASSNWTTFNVFPANSTVSGKNVTGYYGEPIIVEVTSKNATAIMYQIIDETGEVVFEGTLAPDENITVLNLPVGQYTVNLTAKTDKNHIPSHNQSKITVKPIIDLETIVTVDKSVVNYGDVVEFIITVKNNGPCNATEVYATIILEDGLVYIANNCSDESYESIKELLMASDDSQSYDPSSGIWYIGNLNKNESVSLKILAKADYLGTRSLNASAAGNEKEIDYTNNDDSANVTVKPKVDLEITKKVDKTKIKEGQKVTYTIVIKNNGPHDATGVKVTDKLVTKHKFESASSDDYNPQTGEWNVGDLANGSSKTLTITVTIAKAGTYENTAVITCNEFDTNESNNNASSHKVVVSKKSNNNESHENNESHDNPSVVGKLYNPVKMHETGNPIAVLLAMVFVLILPIGRFRK